jgi:hypothetical protein
MTMRVLIDYRPTRVKVAPTDERPRKIHGNVMLHMRREGQYSCRIESLIRSDRRSSMIPFSVSRSWYEEHWLTDRPAPSAAWTASVLAARIIGIVGLLVAGLRGFGHH